MGAITRRSGELVYSAKLTLVTEGYSEAFDRLKRAELARLASDTRPVMVSIGGQPGAGKSRAIARIRHAYLPDHNLYEVNGDAYRAYHPDHHWLIADPDPSVFPLVTASLSAALVEQTLAWAREHKVSVIVEGTLRRPEVTGSTLTDFHAAGFSTHLVVMAVPQAFSWQGCVGRYVDALHRGSPARWAPLEAHQAGWEGVPLTLEHVMSNGAADRVSIVLRDGSTIYDAQTTSPNFALRAACEALEWGRQTALKSELISWQSRQEDINAVADLLDESIRTEALTCFPLPSIRTPNEDTTVDTQHMRRIMGGRTTAQPSSRSTHGYMQPPATPSYHPERARKNR